MGLGSLAVSVARTSGFLSGLSCTDTSLLSGTSARMNMKDAWFCCSNDTWIFSILGNQTLPFPCVSTHISLVLIYLPILLFDLLTLLSLLTLLHPGALVTTPDKRLCFAVCSIVPIKAQENLSTGNLWLCSRKLRAVKDLFTAAPW